VFANHGTQDWKMNMENSLFAVDLIDELYFGAPLESNTSHLT